MAGPEPYPQVKWTREQENAYAEGRKSAQTGSKARSSPSSSSSGRKRYVRTAEGAKRYHVPIGAEIGSARNAAGAKAQKDTESTDRYRALVGGDARAQAEAMNSLSNDQLQRLAQVAYSFRSSDPDVVRLRLGVAAALKRRGFDVNNFGGLGGGSTRPTGPAPVRKAVVPVKKVAPAPAPTIRKAASAMAARVNDRKLREMSVPQLRSALGAFSRIAPDKRQAVARLLVRRALELAAPNLLGRSVIEAANLSQEGQARVIELAGKWRHGWIPLDGAAMRAKMKGGNGKPWWSGGKQKRTSSAERMRKSVDAGRAAREGRTVPRNKPSVNKATTKVTRSESTGMSADASKPKPFVAVPKSSKPDRIPTDVKGTEFRKQTDGSYTEHVQGRKSKNTADQGFSADLVQQVRRSRANLGKERKAPHHTQTKGDYAFKKRDTSKSSISPELQKQIDEHNAAARSSTGLQKLRERAAANRHKPLGFTTHKADGSTTFTDTSSKRTDVVKSSPKPERGSKMESKRDELNRISSKPIGQRTMTDYNRMAELRKELQDPPLQHSLPSGKLHTRPTAIDSRHPGATMSDREFAQLQMRRDAAPRGQERVALTKKINAENAARRGETTAAVVPKGAPSLPPHTGTVSRKIGGAPAGTQAYTVTGTTLYDTALFDDSGSLLGFAKKRSGSSAVGRSGQATLVKNKGYTMYDSSGKSLGSHGTRAGALDLLAKRSSGKA